MSTAASPFQLKTPLGPEALQFLGLSASEEMSRLFEFQVRAVGDPAQPVELRKLLAKPVTVSLMRDDGSYRHFNGLVAACGLDGAQGKRPAYRLTLRPWLWLLTRRADTRIFQNMDLQAILRKVFEPYGGEVAYEQLSGLPTYDYCVQYRETDFNFVSRMMEAEGLYYFFRHEEGRHTLVIANKKAVHVGCPGQSTLAFRDSAAGNLGMDGVIDEWRTQVELQPGKLALTDYHFETPSTSLLVSTQSTVSGIPPMLEVYDQPGEYREKSAGDRYAKLRMEEIESRQPRVHGHSLSRCLVAGHLFTLEEHPLRSENVKHLLIATQIEAHYGGYESGQGQLLFDCRFVAMPADTQFRAQRITPKPSVAGPQTAVVVGPAGEEIHTDPYGRVKVQFHWDREGKKDEHSSCWLRVASSMAGKGFGMIAVPRIGQEVVVGFIEGDPDQPIILGSVYNAEQITPYALPERKTLSTWRSQSSMGNARADFNEIALEDDKGSEYIRLHAQKDLVEIVRNDAHLQVGNDQFRTVGKNLTEEIGDSAALTIAKNLAQTVGEEMHLTVGKEVAWAFGDKLNLDVGQDASQNIGASLSINVATNGDLKFGANLGIEAGANVHIKGGGNLTIEAGGTLTLKGALVHIEGSGPVSIKGATVLVNSGGAGSPGSGAKPKKPKAPKEPAKAKPLADKVKAIDDQLKTKR